MKITVEQDISLVRIADLLCCALEGGSNYWCCIVAYVEPSEIDWDSFKDDSVLCGPDVYRHIHYPLSKDGGVICKDINSDSNELIKIVLDLNSIKLGLETMSKKCPQHFADFLQENEDSVTGDVFLQCCLFGDVIFG